MKARMPEWLPLRQAVFRFAISDESSSKAILGIAAELTPVEVAGSTAFSLADLEKTLAKKANAKYASIDPLTCDFLFTFDDDNGNITGTTPWAILDWPKKEAVVHIPDGHADLWAQRLDAIKFATGIVWRQLMCRAFDRVVSAERVVFKARIGSTSKPMESFGSDIWSMLDIIDWRNGVACGPRGELYYSIHAARISEPLGDISRSFKEDDDLRVAEMRELVISGKAKSAKDASWKVVHRAQRLGTEESAAERLERRYGEKYGTRKKKRAEAI